MHAPTQTLLNLHDEPIPSLDSFVASANTQVLEMLRACPTGRALYLWGSPGAGRSHLLRAVAITPTARYVPASRAAAALHRIMHEADESASAEDNEDRAANLTCIAVDDVHLLDTYAQAALFTLYNRWRATSAGPQAFFLVTTGDRAPAALNLREDLRTRLGWDWVFRLQDLSDAERAQALCTRAALRGVTLAPDLVQWLLTHHSRDMRSLTALIDDLDRYSLQTLKPITLPLLKTVLSQHHDANPTGAV